MAAKTLVIRVSAIVSFLTVTTLDGEAPDGEAWDDGAKALRMAAAEADGSPTTVDGELELDLEGNGGDEELAIEILSGELERRGYEVLIARLVLCPTCEGNERDGCPTCGGRGESMPPDFPPVAARPVPWSGTVWSCYACNEVLEKYAPYTSGCSNCGGHRRHEFGGNPGGCPTCGGAMELLCDNCDLRERQWQEGEDVPMPKPPEPQGDA